MDIPTTEHVVGGQSTNGYAKVDPYKLADLARHDHPELAALIDAYNLKSFTAEHPNTPAKTSTYADLERILPETRWLWHPYLPCGYLTMLAADSGVGKTAAVMHIARHVLSGSPFPDGSDCQYSQYVLLCDTEVFQVENIKRMKTWGIERDRVLAPFEDPSADFFLDQDEHLKRLARVANTYKPGLILIDSLSGGHTQDEISVETGRAIRNLATTIRNLSYQPAVIVTHHVNSGGQMDIASPPVTLRRIRGHTSTRQYFRVILGMHTPDAEQPKIKRIHFVKSNLSEFGKDLGIMWTDEGKLRWCDPPAIKQSTEEGGEKVSIADFLRALLKDGPMLAEDVYQEGAKLGFSTYKLFRAKDEANVKSEKRTNRWYWHIDD